MTHEPSEIELVFSIALDELRSLLGEAIDHLDHNERRAAIGAMVSFEDHVETVRAALHLLRDANRRRNER